MLFLVQKRSKQLIFKLMVVFTVWSFFVSQFSLGFLQKCHAQNNLNLPDIGVMVMPTTSFIPAVMKGVKIFPDNPLRFDFIIDTGNTKMEDAEIQEESSKLIKYFLASLTVPDDELWVNLSPYERDRIIPDKFGVTEMGRDLLAQDYVLKQLTASMIYPEEELGEELWDRVYTKANGLYGTSEIPVNTFNKVWVVPEKAIIYVNGDIAFIVESHLKVMLEGDYFALKENMNNGEIKTETLDSDKIKEFSSVCSEIIREVILPEIEKEVNKGENFLSLRQIYNSMILATWFKRNLRESLLGQVYVGGNKVNGVDIEDKKTKEKIYQQYLEAFEVGVYNYIKEDYDPSRQEIIPRKYFSGGVEFGGNAVDNALVVEERSREDLISAARDTPDGNLITALAVINPIREDGTSVIGVASSPLDDDRQRTTEERTPGGDPEKQSASSMSSLVSQMRSRMQDGPSDDQVDLERRTSNAEFLEYQLRYTGQRHNTLDQENPLYRETALIFESLVNARKSKGEIPSDRNYQLIISDSNDVNASYVVDSDYVFVSKGLLDELDRYLKQEGKAGVSRDHIAFILAHELQHSVQRFDSFGQSWSEKTGDSRKKEYDADTESIFLSDLVGYNPNAALDVMEFFIYAENNATLKERMGRVFGTHPQSVDRRNRLESIIQDKNVLFLNTGKKFQTIPLTYEDHLISRLASIRSSTDLENFSGEIHEIVSMLSIMRNSDFVDRFGNEYGIGTDLKDIFNEQSLRVMLRNYIKNRYGQEFSQRQQDLLYEIHFGFLFEDQLKRGINQDEIFTKAYSTRITSLLDQLNPQEVRSVYLTIAANPPIFTSDLPTNVEKDTKYEKEYFSKVRKLYFLSLSLSTSLMMERFDQSVLEGTRDIMKAIYHFYHRPFANNEEFSKYWQRIMSIFGRQLMDKDSIMAFIDQVKDVFEKEYTVRDLFYREFIVALIEGNDTFNRLSILDQVELIQHLLSNNSKLKNNILRLFWDKNQSAIVAPSQTETREILVRLLKNFDLSHGELDRKLFFDDTGSQVLYIGSQGITAVDQEKSLYGEFTKALSEAMKEDPLEDSNRILEEVFYLFEQNILLDYQDFMRLYGEVLERLDADVYLRIADSIKQFIERNNLGIKDQESSVETPQKRVADYHDMFILAYFYKRQGIPFAFYQSLDSDSAYSDDWGNDARGVKRRVQSYRQYEKIPLLLDVKDVHSDEIATFRSGNQAFGKGQKSFFMRLWRFKFNNVFTEVFSKIGFRPTVRELIILRDRLLNQRALDDWMSLFYQYAELNDGEILEIIAHLKNSEKDENNPKARGKGKDNPLSLVNSVRSVEMFDGRSVDSVGEQRALAKGFQLWGNRQYAITSLEELEEVIDELNRYFPYDSRIKNMEIEKILTAYLSHIAGMPYAIRSIDFRYYLDGSMQIVAYEGYVLNAGINNFSPSEEEAMRLLEGFEKIYPSLSNDRKLFFGKLLYRMFRNNKELTSFKNIRSNIDLLEMLFPFYSKAKDDFVIQALDEHEISVSDYQDAIKRTTRFALQDGEAAVNKSILGLELLKEAVRYESRPERKKTILWLITGNKKYKPAKIVEIETKNNANAVELIDLFWALTDSERNDLLSEVLKGERGLFEVQYAQSEIKTKVKDQGTQADVLSRIKSRYNVNLHHREIRNKLHDLYMEGFQDIMYGKESGKNQLEREWKHLVEEYPYLSEQILTDLKSEIKIRNLRLSELRGIIEQALENTLMPRMRELGIDSFDEEDFLTIMLEEFLYSFEDIGTFSGDELQNEIFKVFVEAIDLETNAGVNMALYRVSEVSEKDPTEEQNQLVNRLVPVVRELAKKSAASISSLTEASNRFVDNHINVGEINIFYQRQQQEAESEVDQVFSVLDSPNPSYLGLMRLLQKYNISVSYQEELQELAEFEEFLDELIEGQMRGIFDGEAYQTLKGLIEVKFKYHSLDRRVQFLNGLLPSLHGKKDKGDVIVAIAEQSGIPVLKFVQILSQRKAFVPMEEDPEEGARLNEKIGSVKSGADPIPKATIFQILEQEGLFHLVKALGQRLGSASIKQVHKLILAEPITVDGQEFFEVALKVKRPSALKHLGEDFYVLEKLIEFFNGRHPESAVSRDTFEKSKTAINEELDFNREVEAQRRFFANMLRRGSKLKAPIVFTSSEKKDADPLLILEEFIDGILLKDVKENQEEAKRSYQTLDEFFKQVFVDGLYHADLHDGNVIVTAEKEKDALIDVGGYSEVPVGKKRVLYRLLESVLMGKANKLINAIKEFDVMVDPKMESRIRSIFQESKSHEERFEEVFLVLNDYESGVPNSLFMFFQAMSKVGKYFDNIGRFRQVILFVKYKFLVSLKADKPSDNPLSAPSVQIGRVAQSSSDNALLSAKDSNVGGIDLNPAFLQLQTQGGGIKFALPDPQTIQNIKIEGFTPVIFQIVPTNFPLLMGTVDLENEQQLQVNIKNNNIVFV